MVIVKTEKELKAAIKNHDHLIRIEGPLAKKVINKLKINPDQGV